uniref:Uncharacterized protein n=1 Tax=Cannabis sativa TaxID=3483 RepID=A0A803Q9R6_CANSA
MLVDEGGDRSSGPLGFVDARVLWRSGSQASGFCLDFWGFEGFIATEVEGREDFDSDAEHTKRKGREIKSCDFLIEREEFELLEMEEDVVDSELSVWEFVDLEENGSDDNDQNEVEDNNGSGFESSPLEQDHHPIEVRGVHILHRFVSDKFGGRERMRKLGKRGFPKMFNSKKSPYLFVRPGVVRGFGKEEELAQNFPAEVKTTATFQVVRVSSRVNVNGVDQNHDQYAYQTAVTIGGHVFKDYFVSDNKSHDDVDDGGGRGLIGTVGSSSTISSSYHQLPLNMFGSTNAFINNPVVLILLELVGFVAFACSLSLLYINLVFMIMNQYNKLCSSTLSLSKVKHSHGIRALANRSLMKNSISATGGALRLNNAQPHNNQQVPLPRSYPISFNHSLSIKLDEHNFLPSKFLTTADQISNIVNPEFEDWEQQDNLLVFWLLSFMSEKTTNQMIRCDTTAQIWENLTEYYTTLNAAIGLYKTQFRNTKMIGSLSDYLLKIKGIVDRLATIGHAQTAQDHIEAIFNGLPPECDVFVTSITTRKETYTVAEVEAFNGTISWTYQLRSYYPAPAAPPGFNTGQGCGFGGSPFNNNSGSYYKSVARGGPSNSRGSTPSASTRGGHASYGRGQTNNWGQKKLVDEEIKDRVALSDTPDNIYSGQQVGGQLACQVLHKRSFVAYGCQLYRGPVKHISARMVLVGLKS